MRFRGWATGIGAVVAVVIVFALLFDAATPNSTQGVVVVGGNEVRLPTGETFVLTHQVGKTINVWEITYDGHTSVRFHCDSWLCSDLPTATLTDVGGGVDVDTGWGDHFHVSLRSDGTASVKWPWGWNYRPYQP